MKCPTCAADGQRSRVYDEGRTTTCLGISYYWDEDGVQHYHDPNISTANYRCSAGHRWAEKHQTQCAACVEVERTRA